MNRSNMIIMPKWKDNSKMKSLLDDWRNHEISQVKDFLSNTSDGYEGSSKIKVNVRSDGLYNFTGQDLEEMLTNPDLTLHQKKNRLGGRAQMAYESRKIDGVKYSELSEPQKLELRIEAKSKIKEHLEKMGLENWVFNVKHKR